MAKRETMDWMSPVNAEPLWQKLNSNYVQFVGVVVMVNGKEVIKRARDPVPVDPRDMLEIELDNDLFIKLARKPEIAFGVKSDVLGSRAERRREQKTIKKSLRLISLE